MLMNHTRRCHLGSAGRQRLSDRSQRRIHAERTRSIALARQIHETIPKSRLRMWITVPTCSRMPYRLESERCAELIKIPAFCITNNFGLLCGWNWSGYSRLSSRIVAMRMGASVNFAYRSLNRCGFGEFDVGGKSKQLKVSVREESWVFGDSLAW